MKKNVAFISFGIGDIRGGGGAERFFADLFDYYSRSGNAAFNLYWLLDQQSKKNLAAVNKLSSNTRVVTLKLFSNRFKHLLENLQVAWFIVFNRIALVHVPLYNLYYLPVLKFIQKMPAVIRPKLSVNIVDCSLPFCYLDAALPRHGDIHRTWVPLFKNVRVNGYIAWNRNFIDFVNSEDVLAHPAQLFAIKSRFCDTGKFLPARKKQNKIVFASRIAVFKKAEWFAEAVLYLKNHHPQLIEGWQFLICGDGPYKPMVVKFAEENDLLPLLTFTVEPRLEHVLNHSKCFVSCQDFDNFPSLSMAEAMASGNVIVSRNVGQTSLFVEDGKNGFLAKEDSATGIALALVEFLQNQQRFDEMSAHSIYLTRQVHSPENFIPQIDAYWSDVLSTH